METRDKYLLAFHLLCSDKRMARDSLRQSAKCTRETNKNSRINILSDLEDHLGLFSSPACTIKINKSFGA
jgi:hypothetical protein